MLKKEEWIILAVFLLFASLFIYFNQEGLVGITGMAVSDASFDVVLTKTKLNAGEQLLGYLNITFSNPVDSSTKVKVEFGDSSTQLGLKDYFNSKNISFTETEESASASNPLETKTISFEASGSKVLAFKLPKYADVDSFYMVITGIGSPSFVSFDVEDYTNKKEWKYFGSFVSFKDDYIYPASLDIAKEYDAVYLANGIYFCEAVELPESKHFNLSAKVKRNFDGANIKAVLLSFDGEYASGGADFCDLPEPGVGLNPDWYSCDLSFTKSKQGIYLVCVYFEGDNEKDYYELSRDSNPSDSKFDCPITGGDSYCMKSTSKNYFIRVKAAEYSGVLSGTVNWVEGVTDQGMDYSLIQFLQDCVEDEIGDCVIPVAISSESAGDIKVSDLRIDYTEQGGGTSYSNKFYDVVELPGSIAEIDGVKLENASKTIQISLSEFNITAPNITEDSKTFYLEVRLTPGDKISKPVKVFSEAYVPETGTVEDKIAGAKAVFSSMESEHGDVLSLFGIELDDKLASFESEINRIKADTNLSVEEADAQWNTLSNQIDTFLKTQPKSFGVTTSFKDLYVPELESVEKVVPEESGVESVYFYQDNVEVSVEVTNYVLEKYDGSEEKYSVVTKIVTPKKTLSNIYIYEVVPKTFASSIASIVFKNQDYEVVEHDPIVRYTFASLSQPTTIMYGVKNVAVSPSMLYSLGSIIVPKEVGEVVEKTHECGDGVCTTPYEDEIVCPEDCGGTRIPWVLIVVLVVLLIAGVAYINFYRGKGAFRKLISRSPFPQPKNLEDIKNYIKIAQNKKMKNQDIAKALLKSGWTKNQIVYAFEDLKWDEKRLFTIKFAPSSKENVRKLHTFIKKCLQLNIPQGKIRHVLIEKGWPSYKVDEAFALIGKPEEKVETEEEKKKKTAFYFEKELEEEAKK